MPEFRDEHLEEHKAIHAGLDGYVELLRAFKAEPTSYNPSRLRAQLESWGPVLFYHLDAEVATLKGDNLRRCEYTSWLDCGTAGQGQGLQYGLTRDESRLHVGRGAQAAHVIVL